MTLFGHCLVMRVKQMSPLDSATLIQYTFIPHTYRLSHSTQSDLHRKPSRTLLRVRMTFFWTLLGSESEMDMTIGLSNPNLVHFDTPNLNIGQREPNMLFFQNALLRSSQNGLSIFTQRAFKGRRCDRSWIRKRLQNQGAFLKKICKIQPKSLLPARFPGKKVRWVGPRKRPSKGGKQGFS